MPVSKMIFDYRIKYTRNKVENYPMSLIANPLAAGRAYGTPGEYTDK